MKRKKIQKSWVNEFLNAMEKDLKTKKYKNINETVFYMKGSAEVVGLMMCKILNIPKQGHPYAKLLGRSMQYINFIRDIKEDLNLNRNYFPQDQLKKYKLKNLEYKTALTHPEEFKQFIRSEINRYFIWQKKAEKGFKYIPKKYLLPIKTSSDLYKWTAQKIYNDPFIVYTKRVKPSMSTIITRTGSNLFSNNL
jgi:15-cis-phytoene synthase